MQELVGRLTALDSEASESLKVIGYFDALVAGRADAGTLLRGAAILAGCGAGFRSTPAASGAGSTIRRVTATGSPIPRSDATATLDTSGWLRSGVPGVLESWLERHGEQHANDAMILERLTLALSITLDRSSPRAAVRRAVETLLDDTQTPEARAEAGARLGLDATRAHRVVAMVGCDSPGDHPAATVFTPVGSVCAVVLPLDHSTSAIQTASRDLAHDALTGYGAQRVGVGFARSIDSLDRSFASAVLALRMTAPLEPALDASQLGTLMALAETSRLSDEPGDPSGFDDGSGPLSDVAALRRETATHPRLADLLDAIVGTESLRAAAAVMTSHHSTLQSKVADLSAALGWDIRSPFGRVRLATAVYLLRLTTNRFGDSGQVIQRTASH